MKKIILLFIISNTIIAQVGINIKDPLGILHIDALSNNNNIIPTLLLDDVIISNTGDIGLGSNNFDTKLNISTNNNSALRIADGNQAFQKKLISDANGVGTWGTPKNKAHWIKSTSLIKIQPPYLYAAYSGKSITLSKGTWLIKYNFLWTFQTATSQAYLDIILTTSSTTFTDTTLPGSWIISPVNPGVAFTSSQNMIVYTVTNSSETLYIWTYHNGSQLTDLKSNDNILEAIRWE